MNRTNFEHAIYALLMQAAIGLLTGNWLAGACFGAAFFLGREHAQAEARVGNWAKYPEFECFAPRYWSLDAVLDFAFPTVAVAFVFISLGL